MAGLKRWPILLDGLRFSQQQGFIRAEFRAIAVVCGQSELWRQRNPHPRQHFQFVQFIILAESARSDASPSRGGLYPLSDNSDPTQYYNFPGGPAIGNLASQARPFKRHFDGVIFGSLDGHAKWIRPEKTGAAPVPAPALNGDNQWSRDVQ